MSLTKIFKNKVWLAFWQFLFRCFIAIGLPLLGWGLDDLAGFFSSPVRVSFVIVVTAQALINAWLLNRAPPPPPPPNQRFEPYHSFFDVVEMIYFLAAFGDRRDILSGNASLALGWLGLGIYLCGSSLSTWANFTWADHLRREGKRAYDNPVLLREGPFRWIRYPGLLCLVFYGLGAALIFHSWLGLVLVIVLIGTVGRRANNLERDYAEQYQKLWPERCRTSKRLIPFVY